MSFKNIFYFYLIFILLNYKRKKKKRKESTATAVQGGQPVAASSWLSNEDSHGCQRMMAMAVFQISGTRGCRPHSRQPWTAMVVQGRPQTAMAVYANPVLEIQNSCLINISIFIYFVILLVILCL